ncbi:unnamed protein product [Mytilus coruscus]|uniref:Uncharacterized protein n=1 Tax=Mytilus coruscus TaxID=42192 RepID=A0A6J8DGQ9_MYTCO|nr:unnamed protein product [Mytilus coruscus]
MKTYVAFEANENNIHEILLFFNSSITKEGKLLNYKPFIFAGITKVKHLTYEVIPGFLKFIAIHEILSEKDADLKYDDVCKFYRNVLVSLPPEWVHFINENINPVSKNYEINADCFSFSVEDKEVPMPQSTRTFYNLLIQLVGKSPVSESYWIEKYPELELSKCCIFSNLYILPGECRELIFQVLHRTLFTKVKLLKCNMSDNDTCSVCAQSREDLEHMFINCVNLSQFTDFLKDFLLNFMCNVDDNFVNTLDFDQAMLMGFLKRSNGFNFYFANFIMSIARFSIYKRKNFILLNPQAKLNLVDYFKTLLEKYISHYFYLLNQRKEHFLLENILYWTIPLSK